ncbi:hypothetical protein D3C84_347440 [compost metagenome]
MAKRHLYQRGAIFVPAHIDPLEEGIATVLADFIDHGLTGNVVHVRNHYPGTLTGEQQGG